MISLSKNIYGEIEINEKYIKFKAKENEERPKDGY